MVGDKGKRVSQFESQPVDAGKLILHINLLFNCRFKRPKIGRQMKMAVVARF